MADRSRDEIAAAYDRMLARDRRRAYIAAAVCLALVVVIWWVFS